MPHLILEYSDNIFEKNNLTTLFQQCHRLLAETLPTDIVNCKSRAVECKTYVAGNGESDQAFVHVDLKIMSGRTTEKLQNVGQKIMELLSSYFAVSLQKLRLQITLEISELSPNYFKTDHK